MHREVYFPAPNSQKPVSTIRYITKEEFDQNTSWSSQSNHKVSLPNQSQLSNLSFISEKRIDIPTVQSIVLPNSIHRIAVEPSSVMKQEFIPNSSLDYSQLSRSSRVNLSPQFVNYDFANNGSSRGNGESKIPTNEFLKTVEIRHPPKITILSPVEVIKPSQKISETPIKSKAEGDEVNSFSSEVLKLSFVNKSLIVDHPNNSPTPNKIKRSILISKNQNGGLSKKSGLRESMVTFDPKVDVKTFNDDLTPEKPNLPKITEEHEPVTHLPILRKSSIEAEGKQFTQKFLRESEEEPSDSEKEYELENVFNEARRKTRRTNKSLRDILNTPRMSANSPSMTPKTSNTESLQQAGQSVDPKFIALGVILVIVFSILYEIFTKNKSNPYL